jgi:hypothetical protein
MEGKILQAVNFNVTVTSSYLFLNRYHKLLGHSDKVYMMARYLQELALVEYNLLKFS